MKRKKLLQALADFLDKEGRKQRERREDLEILLEKLEKKKVQLEGKLQEAKGQRKQKNLQKQI